MSNRTWVCLDCRKSFRRNQRVRVVKCSGCGRPCEYVHWKLHIPSPKNRRAWDAFWAQYLLEKREIERFEADRSTEEVDLPLLNRRLSRTGKTQRGRRNVGLS